MNAQQLILGFVYIPGSRKELKISVLEKQMCWIQTGQMPRHVQGSTVLLSKAPCNSDPVKTHGICWFSFMKETDFT